MIQFFRHVSNLTVFSSMYLLSTDLTCEFARSDISSSISYTSAMWLVLFDPSSFYRVGMVA
jgi:hypothetical protein